MRPPPLGPEYRKLWTASAVSTVGDGVHYAALALLAASLTRDPLQVSAVVFAGELPVLLLILPGGALVDRWDRRTVLWTVDIFRCIVVAALAAAVLAGWASIPLLAGAAFLLGAGETLFNTAAQAIVPAIVSRDPQQLDRANGRLQGASIVGQQFIGPPTGGLLFSLAASIPFWINAISFAASSALLAAIPGRFRHQRQANNPTSLRTEIMEGLRWLLPTGCCAPSPSWSASPTCSPAHGWPSSCCSPRTSCTSPTPATASCSPRLRSAGRSAASSRPA